LVEPVPGPVPQRGVAAWPAAFGEFAVQGHEGDAATGLGDASGEVGVMGVEIGMGQGVQCYWSVVVGRRRYAGSSPNAESAEPFVGHRLVEARAVR
jgi:hypothetical protein